MTKEAVSWKRVLLIAGALCACFMGAGFTSGQEVLQFFTSLGSMGLVSIGISWILFVYFIYMIYRVSNRENFSNPYDILEYYCGKILGKFMVWYTFALMYSVFLVMLTGAGATINQYYNLPVSVGVWGVGLLALGTVVLGVEKLINIIGVIGPVKVLFIVVICIPSVALLLSSPETLAEADKAIPTLEIKRATSNWTIAGFLYPCLYVMSAVPFLVACGASASNIRESTIAGILGITGFMISVLMLVAAELVNIVDIAGKQVPTLVVADKISQTMGVAFVVLIILCIYSTASSYLWTVTRKFAKDKTKNFYIVAVAFTAVGVLLGERVPFDVLVNTLYPISGYIGIIFLVSIIVKQLKDKFYTVAVQH